MDTGLGVPNFSQYERHYVLAVMKWPKQSAAGQYGPKFRVWLERLPS